MIAWFYSQVLTEPSTTRPCSWHWQILTQSQSNTSEFRVLSFTTLEPRVLHAMALFTAWWPGTPRVTPWVPHIRGKSGHNLSVGTCQTCPENSTSRLTVRMLLRAPHTRGEFKWLHYIHCTAIHWPVDLAPDSSLFSSWAELCFALMGRLSYVRRDYLIRIPPHEPVLIPCSFTHLEVRPLMTWVQTCNWTFCSVKAQARDTDYFRYEYFVVL